MAEYQFPGRPEKLDRKVIITWPQPMAGTVRPWAVTITDADTGEQISTVSKAVLEVHLDAADALTWAAVEAFAAEDGTLVTGSAGIALEAGDSVRTRVFAFEVTEMRVALPAVLGGEATVHGFAPAGGRPEPRRFQYHVGAQCGTPNLDGTCGCRIASGAGGHE
jgi:hypothetical protein